MTTPRHRLAASLETPDDPPVMSIMATRLTGVPPDTDLTAALRLMTSMHVHHLPVIGPDGRYLGVIDDAELAHHLAQGLGLPYSGWLRVGALVRRAVPVSPTARRSDAARQMLADESDVVLVADDDKPCGILTATDVLRSLTRPDEFSTTTP